MYFHLISLLIPEGMIYMILFSRTESIVYNYKELKKTYISHQAHILITDCIHNDKNKLHKTFISHNIHIPITYFIHKHKQLHKMLL